MESGGLGFERARVWPPLALARGAADGPEAVPLVQIHESIAVALQSCERAAQRLAPALPVANASSEPPAKLSSSA